MRVYLPVLTLITAGTGLGLVTDYGGSIHATGAMDVPRFAHTMTLLPDGRVLVVGGFGATNELEARPMVFEPGSMRFRTLRSSLEWRHSHTATLLADGTVLLAGGYGEGNRYLRSAEIFDPRDGTSRRVSDLSEARAGHVAAPLPDGRILITGGVGDGWTFLATSELYDPVRGRFVPTGSLGTARESHVATRLRDGRILVTGGHGGTRRDLRVLDSAEIYDPGTGRFTRTGDLTIRRHKHDAVALADGRVLVLGGADERDERGVYRSTELYDPATGRFVEHADLQLGRYKLAGSTVPLDDGRFLVAGGAARPEVYEPAEQRFRVIPAPEPLAGLFSATTRLADGRVLISGGYGAPGGPTARAWLFDPR